MNRLSELKEKAYQLHALLAMVVMNKGTHESEIVDDVIINLANKLAREVNDIIHVEANNEQRN